MAFGIRELIFPISSIIGGIILGIVFEKIILKRLRKMAEKTKWKGDEVLIKAVHGMTIFWFIIAGLYLAVLNLPIDPTISGHIEKALLVILIFSVTMFAAKLAAGFVDISTEKARGALPSTSILTNLTRILVFLIGILIILQALGISITPILTAFGVGGIAVALALQDTLSNFFAGIHILISKQVKPGDYVKLEAGEEGYVTDVSWRNTTIRALQNNMIIVPNAKLASAILVNYYQPKKEMSVYIEVGVSYDSDLDKVERVTIEVAKEVIREIEGGLEEFEPFIRYHTFADFSINFTMIMRVKEAVDQYRIKHEFVKRLHRRYGDEGIDIPFPIRTIQMESPIAHPSDLSP